MPRHHFSGMPGHNFNPQLARHVVLISIDGFRPDFYSDKSWPRMNRQVLMKEGTYADHMKSVFPSYTYPSQGAGWKARTGNP